MKRLFFVAVLVIACGFLLPAKTLAANCGDPTQGADRCTTCDLCGYCKGGAIPGNWAKCAACLYPGITTTADTNDTLLVDPTAQTPITPVPGAMYTFLGCIRTTEAGFEDSKSAGDVVQFLLAKIIFSGVGGIALLYLIYGAFTILTSQNEPEKLYHGRRIVMGAVIGVAFAMGSIFLVNLIANNILKIPGFN